jgi:hypothetical protein
MKSLLILFILLCIRPLVQAAIINVSTTQDNVPGSLRAAITTANTNGEDDTILLPAGIYVLDGAPEDDENISGDLDINTINSITIIGKGAEFTIIDGNQVDRVIHINSGIVSISGVTIQNGKAPNGKQGEGGEKGEYNGKDGGGIYNNGILHITECTIKNNRSGNGGSYYKTIGGKNLGKCNGGRGGGVYNIATLTLKNCIVSNNITGIGGYYVDEIDYPYYIPNPFPGGKGGGIYNSGTLLLEESAINKNATSCGGGSGGDGGGIYNESGGETNISKCSLNNNTTGNGGPGFDVFAGSNGGNGAGLYNNGKIKLNHCTIKNNTTGNGGYSPNDNGGKGGNGSGIFNSGLMTIINSTVTNNKTGKGGNAEWYGAGRGGDGGGIYNRGTSTVTNCTICNNSTGKGASYVFEPDIGGSGGGIYNENTVNIKNTIIADNQVAFGGEGADCAGSLNSYGYNLIENTNNTTINGTLTGNITGQDPMLAPLANNGGPTYTHGLLPGSPAIDAGRNFGYNYDQRGYTRPIDVPGIPNIVDGIDIGAYEYNAYPAPLISLNRSRLNFGVHRGDITPNTKTFLIYNSGGGILNWSIIDDADWLNCTPVCGTDKGIVTVSVYPSGLPPGTYIGTIKVEALNAFNSPQTVDVSLVVYKANATGIPFGYFETPRDGAYVYSSIPVTGWALDDIEVESVKIYREEEKNLVYIGDAIFLEGARPDVEQAYPNYPNSYKAGWGYMMLTNFLPNGGNGIYILHAIATDKEGNQVTLGKKTIECDNANAFRPFGAIDTPPQGGTASGTNYRNQGWVLTPPPNKIPEDGHTIIVWIDVFDIGKPIYNIYRPDIAELFPGYANSNGAMAYFDFDTSTIENGVHTIQWTAVDDAGNTDGIGSRYFTVQNSGNNQQALGNRANVAPIVTMVQDLSKIPVDYSGPVRIKKGYDNKIEPKTVYPNDNGNITIQIKELQRIEIDLKDGEENPAEHTPKEWIGYHIIGNQLRRLPIGSYLDSNKGTFCWQPGPGFVRTYQLVFIAEKPNGEYCKKFITIKILPKFSRG